MKDAGKLVDINALQTSIPSLGILVDVSRLYTHGCSKMRLSTALEQTKIHTAAFDGNLSLGRGLVDSEGNADSTSDTPRRLPSGRVIEVITCGIIDSLCSQC